MSAVVTKNMSIFQKQVYFWLPAQAVNFFLLPTRLRVLYVGACSFLWMNLLCWVKRSPVPETEVKRSPVPEAEVKRSPVPETEVKC